VSPGPEDLAEVRGSFLTTNTMFLGVDLLEKTMRGVAAVSLVVFLSTGDRFSAEFARDE
jgi:hypothetical protein